MLYLLCLSCCWYWCWPPVPLVFWFEPVFHGHWGRDLGTGGQREKVSGTGGLGLVGGGTRFRGTLIWTCWHWCVSLHLLQVVEFLLPCLYNLKNTQTLIKNNINLKIWNGFLLFNFWLSSPRSDFVILFRLNFHVRFNHSQVWFLSFGSDSYLNICRVRLFRGHWQCLGEDQASDRAKKMHHRLVGDFGGQRKWATARSWICRGNGSDGWGI